MNPLKKTWYSLRRQLLRYGVPEWVWPKDVLLDGVSFPVRNVKLNFGTKRWIANGLYECDERSLVADVVVPGMNVVEMGGSIGVLARILAHKVGPNGRVVSIEASPELHALATKWCPIPKQLQFVQGFAFPVSNAELVFVSGFHTDGSELDGRAQWELNSIGTPSNGVSWDFNRLAKELGILPQLLVVDIEGGEFVMMDIAPHVPASVEHIVIEFHPHQYGIEGVNGLTQTLFKEGFAAKSTSGLVTLFQRIR